MGDFNMEPTESALLNFLSSNNLSNLMKTNSCFQDLDHVFNNLYDDLNNVLDWFNFNCVKADPDKFQFIVLEANKNKSFSINVWGINILKSRDKLKTVYPVPQGL